YLRSLRVALHVAIRFCERNLLNVQGSKSAALAPIWNRRHRNGFPFGLRQYKPIRLPGEACNEFFVLAGVLVLLLAGPRHAKPDPLFALADLPAFLLPSLVGIDGARLDAANIALHECSKLVAETVAMESGVSFEHQAGLRDGLP